MSYTALQPARFDSEQHIFELKIDGFRALAHIEAGEARLISRNGNYGQNRKKKELFDDPKSLPQDHSWLAVR